MIKEAQGIAGELQWLCGRCRPEITYAVNVLSQTISRAPREARERGHHLLRYLRKYPTGGLVFTKDIPVFEEARTTKGPVGLEVFTDASYAPDGSRSQQALQVYYDGNLVTWASMRQAFVTMSTAESELVAIGGDGLEVAGGLEAWRR